MASAFGQLPSAALAAIMFLTTAVLLQMNAPFFNQSERHTVLAGVLSSSLFFFSMIVVGNLFSNVTWLTLVPCLVISCGIAGTVHRVCITVCFLCSIAITLYMQYMSKRLSQKAHRR